MPQAGSESPPFSLAPVPITPSAKAPGQEPWWRGATIYQIYPRSFQDTNGDGVGDLPGITARLDHIARLGADAIWISPFFTSPMRDFGYDVADYCDIDPIFGTLADFDALVERAHALGLKVIIDQVYAHTSDLHPWFAESRASRGNPRADWYVWHDPKADGTPPCNWQSVFGGPAWTWDARRGQYYMHTFLKEQPQLNMHNPAVQDAVLDVARFWLSRGVDGFRLDALNHAMHDPLLRDNPPRPADGIPRSRPFDFQRQIYNQSHPDMVHFVERLRALCDEFDAIHTVAEIGGDDPQADRQLYTAGHARLNSAYGFDFLYLPHLTPAYVADAIERWQDVVDPKTGAIGGWPSFAFENHDAPRAVSRWAAPTDRDRFARLTLALLLALRGNVILYQGQELGLVQDDIPFELLQDPEAIANWPRTLSRDGARTPMPWRDEPLGGFTQGKPWLPFSIANLARAVETQEHDPGAMLPFTTTLLTLRRNTPALRLGTIEQCVADATMLRFERVHDGQRVLCLFNLSSSEIPLDLDAWEQDTCEILLAANGAHRQALPAFGALYLSLNKDT